MANKRIIDLQTQEELTGSEYVAVDSTDGGTKKVPVDKFGNNYDLIIETSEQISFGNITTDQLTIKHGSILDCEDKIANGETVNAIIIVHNNWSYIPSSSNSSVVSWLLPATFFSCPYTMISFSGSYYDMFANNSAICHIAITIGYNASTGQIRQVASSLKRSS